MQDRKVNITSKLKVDVVEPVGNEIFVYLKMNNVSLCMRMPPKKLYKSGDNIPISMDWSDVHFFHAQTGLKIN